MGLTSQRSVNGCPVPNRPIRVRFGTRVGASTGVPDPSGYIVRTHDRAGLDDLVARLAATGVHPTMQWHDTLFGLLVQSDPATLASVQDERRVRDPEPSLGLPIAGGVKYRPGCRDQVFGHGRG